MLRTLTLLTALAVGPAALATPVGAHGSGPVGPVTATAAAAAAGAAAERTDRVRVPRLVWRPCGGRALCARARVPLDYDRPRGATTRLNLLKMPALRPARRIGTLFVNPGGPGGRSTEFARFFPQLVAQTVGRRFDIVGIDPRGTSTPRQVCRTDEPRPPAGTVAFPRTDQQVRRWLRSDRWIRSACRTGANPITAHMSTADVARDMELIRRAVGDRRLTYYGASYGSYLGQVYASLYPRRIRALVIDGVLDPVAWATGRGRAGARIPFSTRLRSGAGAAEAMRSALRRCDAVPRNRCALSGRATRTWDQLVRRLRRGPVEIEGEVLRYSDLVSFSLSFLYSADAIPLLMQVLDELHRQVFDRDGDPAVEPPPGALRTLRRGPTDGRGLPGPYAVPAARLGRVSDAFLGVSCSDTQNPADPRRWERVARAIEPEQPWFGALWTWVSSPCAGWPARFAADAYRGDFGARRTSAPLLVIGNSHDPATPIHGARVASRLFERSHLLEVRSWGHVALGTGSCFLDTTRDYLVALRPPERPSCAPDRPLYP